MSTATLSPPRPRVWCRHCRRRRAVCPRGLCKRCYWRPEIRARFPVSNSPFARRGLDVRADAGLAQVEPTEHQPGSPGKVAVLEERVRLGVPLFHPADAPGASARKPLGRHLLKEPGAREILLRGLRRGTPYRHLARLLCCTPDTIANCVRRLRQSPTPEVCP